MNILEKHYGNICALIVNIDRATLKEADEFKNIASAKVESGINNFLVDLSACEFIDSTFLGSIVNILKKVSRNGGKLKLTGLQPNVYSMFELTRMLSVFETFTDFNDAINSF